MSTAAKSKSLCVGCRDNFYNTEGSRLALGGECWSYKSAKVVSRWRIGWWTEPTEPGAFQKVTTLNCHWAPGKYAHKEMLPTWAVEPRT